MQIFQGFKVTHTLVSEDINPSGRDLLQQMSFIFTVLQLSMSKLKN